MATPVNKVETAHQLYRDGRYDEALELYTDALATAKSKTHKIALHSNRAACYLKLHDFNKAAAECTSVLELDHKHTGALMLRAQTLVTLKEYQFALFDVNRLLEFNPSSEVYTDLQARLKTQLSLAPIPESEAEVEEENEEDEWKGEPATDKKFVRDREESQKGEAFLTERNVKASPTDGSAHTSPVPLQERHKGLSNDQTKGWTAIPKPVGHSKLDYSRWDRVEDDSSEENEDGDSDNDEDQPRCRFRVRMIGVKPVK